ncbi:TRAP transporter substrate-binding protein [Acidisphaera sp. L21]|uniref:TRAP transporter substrate-binding protein n=1 Tax=Acidisphaera sp. L21 TaxID=1641851 RepID=UPI00131D3CBD|nr:TRAP transporter substrate-binding protein [Acidisphaera sp. L21]
MTATSRRAVLAGATALPLVSILSRRGSAAEFSYKLATNLPITHPLSARNAEAAARIKAATNGRLDIAIFPNSQLGSDTDMLSQVRSGALEFFTLSGLILSTLVPLSAINGIGFAFKDNAQVFAAMDGPLGAMVRAEIGKRGLVAFEHIYDSGYRQVTTSTKPINTPADLKGVKIRVPTSPLWTSMFRAFGSAPTSINFNEVYSALQTRICDGQENPLSVIDAGKLNEVQKYCSMTNHMWDGFWLLANKDAFAALPADVQTIATTEFARAAIEQRADVQALNASLRDSLSKRGLVFNDVDPELFRDALRKAGFYAEWKGKFGDQAWSTLESTVGTLS